MLPHTEQLHGCDNPNRRPYELSTPQAPGPQISTPKHSVVPTTDLTEEDIDRLRGDGIIYGYDQVVAAVMIPAIIGDMVICAIVDTGATVSILSGRVGRLLAKRSGGRLTPTNVVAEVFGNQKGVQFDYQISARISVVAIGHVAIRSDGHRGLDGPPHAQRE